MHLVMRHNTQRRWPEADLSPTLPVGAIRSTDLDQVVGHRMAAPTETLSGLVERVTYHNAENGFCVLRVKARGQRDLVAVVGHAASISAGEFISATGLWTTDREHGLQFKAAQVTTTQPTTLEGIEKYLGSGMSAASARRMPAPWCRRSAMRCST